MGAVPEGVDVALSALRYAQAIAEEFAVKVHSTLASWVRLPFSDTAFDMVFSLGALEHQPEPAQRRILQEMTRVSRRYVVVLVPNKDSPIYKTMEEAEFQTMPDDLVYPEEHHLYTVDLLALSSRCGLTVLENSAIHIVPPLKIPGRHLVCESHRFFDTITQQALAKWTGSATTTWLSVEETCGHEQKAKYGWFSYMVCRKPLRAWSR